MSCVLASGSSLSSSEAISLSSSLPETKGGNEAYNWNITYCSAVLIAASSPEVSLKATSYGYNNTYYLLRIFKVGVVSSRQSEQKYVACDLAEIPSHFVVAAESSI